MTTKHELNRAHKYKTGGFIITVSLKAVVIKLMMHLLIRFKIVKLLHEYLTLFVLQGPSFKTTFMYLKRLVILTSNELQTRTLKHWFGFRIPSH